MEIPVDVWVRGENDATTAHISGVERAVVAWTDDDVTCVLIGMLRALDRARNPDADPERPMVLRGFSWIVNPFEAGGVVIAMEMTVGAVVAGPFEITEAQLSAMIQRVMDADRASVVASGTDTIH
jgi:nicotinamide mononucleotide adenylyltransferase